jgi:hypothetical protein
MVAVAPSLATRQAECAAAVGKFVSAARSYEAGLKVRAFPADRTRAHSCPEPTRAWKSLSERGAPLGSLWRRL